MATLPGAWHYSVSAGTGWPGVSILWLGEMESLICHFYLSVAARKTYPSRSVPEIHQHVAGMLGNQQTYRHSSYRWQGHPSKVTAHHWKTELKFCQLGHHDPFPISVHFLCLTSLTRCTTFVALPVRQDAPLEWLLRMSRCERCKCKWESFMTNQNICCDSLLASSILADAKSYFWIDFYKESLLQKAVPL